MIHFLKAGRDSHESESIGREFQSEKIVCGKKENLYDDVRANGWHSVSAKPPLDQVNGQRRASGIEGPRACAGVPVGGRFTS